MMENADRYLMLRLHLDLFKHRHTLSKTETKDYQIEDGNAGISAVS